MDLNHAIVLKGLLDPAFDFAVRNWLPLHPGVDIAELYPETGDGARAALLRYSPGASVPLHRHGGFEHILILKGSQRDDHGEYGVGTLLINPPGTCHRVVSDEGCIALAIWQRPIQVLDTISS